MSLSKAFTKDFLQRHGIPTAFYGNFTEIEPAVAYLQEQAAPIVIKADGLAAGKGVVIAVLDTGVDMGVEGLKVLPDGKPKVVDVRDFSTEGDLYWEEGHINPGEKGEKIVDNKGRGGRER